MRRIPSAKPSGAWIKPVAAKQAYETEQIKQFFHSPEARADMDKVVAATEAQRAPLAAKPSPPPWCRCATPLDSSGARPAEPGRSLKPYHAVNSRLVFKTNAKARRTPSDAGQGWRNSPKLSPVSGWLSQTRRFLCVLCACVYPLLYLPGSGQAKPSRTGNSLRSRDGSPGPSKDAASGNQRAEISRAAPCRSARILKSLHLNLPAIGSTLSA